jgi:hypothetical protein
MSCDTVRQSLLLTATEMQHYHAAAVMNMGAEALSQAISNAMVVV